VLARERIKTIPINPLGIPAKDFVGEKGDVFGTKERPKEILPFVDRPAWLCHRTLLGNDAIATVKGWNG
jgi:hypothetical protein